MFSCISTVQSESPVTAPFLEKSLPQSQILGYTKFTPPGVPYYISYLHTGIDDQTNQNL